MAVDISVLWSLICTEPLNMGVSLCTPPTSQLQKERYVSKDLQICVRVVLWDRAVAVFSCYEILIPWKQGFSLGIIFLWNASAP